MRHKKFVAVIAISFLAFRADGKAGPTFHTPDQIAKARALCKSADWAVKMREDAEKSAKRWLAMPDQELWDFIPDAETPRALNVRFGTDCPIHGEEIFRKGGHYPWIMSTDEPYQVKCPVGGEVYPTNDYAAWVKGGKKEKLDTHEKYVDDGFGWLDPDGNRYWFVAYYIFWQRWQKDVPAAYNSLSYAYELTGDPKYAHKAAVMLGRFIEIYPKMDYATQAYHNGKWPAGIDGRILDYIWENGTIKHLATAYDRIYDAVDTDAELKTFLAGHGIADFKHEYEQKVLYFMARDVMAGKIRGNMFYQPTLATLAIIIDNNDAAYGPTTKEMVDWLLYGGGEINLILYNGFDRDGAGGETAPGYSSAWNEQFCQVADLLSRLGVEVTKDPRWRSIIRFPYNLTLADKYVPRLGDCTGNIHGADKIIQEGVLQFGFKHFKDPQCAQLLLGQNVYGNSLWEDTLKREEVEAVAKSAPDLTGLATRDMGGYGLTVFDSGKGEGRRAMTMYYGGAEAWHGHHERLTIDYWAHGREFLPEMGYPSHWNDLGDRFVRGMPSHYIVEIDEKRSANKKAGYLDFFVGGTKVRVARAHAEAIYPGVAEIYRRTVAMIDVDDDNSFLVDLFQVKGGRVHDYHFHGLPFGEFSTEDLELVSTQEKGTLLGEDVEWGGDKTDNASGYDFLKNVRKYKPTGTWRARWVGREDCRLAYYMPPFPEVNVTDGEPPFKPDYPEKMEFLVVRDRSPESVFPAVIVPSKGVDIVRSVAFDRDGDSMKYAVETIAGIWTITIGIDSGAVAAERSNDGKTDFTFKANSRDLTKQQMKFVIGSADYANDRVHLKDKIEEPQRLVGQVAIISGNGHSASYTVAEAGEDFLRFNGPAITGMCVVETNEGTTIGSKTRLSGYGTQLTARALKGMALVSEDYAAESVFPTAASILSYDSDQGIQFHLDKPLATPDADGDGRRLAYFADFAPGYEVRFSPWTESPK